METSHFESLYPADSRFTEIEQMLKFIKEGNSCQIIGLPGVGQSTFLKLLAYNKNVRLKHLGDETSFYHFVLINLSELKRRPLVDLVKFIFLSLVESLRERGFTEEYDQAFAVFKESIALNDELVMSQGLKHALDILTLEKNLTIVFLFDMFEDYIPMLTADFFSGLRLIRNRAKFKFGAVFSLNRPLEDSIEPILMSDYYDFLAGHIIYLPLSDTPGIDFRIKHLEELTAKKLDAQLKKDILLLTAGIGSLTKSCIQLALNNGTIEQSNNSLSSFFLSHPSIQAPLMNIWQALSPSEQDFLTKNTAYETSDQDYPYLANVGLLRDGKITISLLQEFIKKSILPQEIKTKTELITFDINTNEIKQGVDIISDRLTSSEFRLLRFLLEHQGIIVERESIINAVWKDAATTLGVTDQAFDQLLFRVRKKIEDDPNSPVHLQTIKGRGIRFTP
jgi:DNA-binding winged helix-turn-helix (wHTH) protein